MIVSEAVKAQRMAEELHVGQVDKACAPYIEHVGRVADRVAAGGHDEAHQAAAWLHDTIEDCGVTADLLLAAGVADDVVAAVVALTRVGNEPYLDAVRRAAANPIARVVKLADNADNGDPERLARLDAKTRERLERKYAAAREILEETQA